MRRKHYALLTIMLFVLSVLSTSSVMNATEETDSAPNATGLIVPSIDGFIDTYQSG